MAILDDVIGVFSPGWKAARLRFPCGDPGL